MRKNFPCFFFLFDFILKHFFVLFVYIRVLCIFVITMFFSIFGNFFLSYMVLGLKWQQRREAFSALRNRMKNSYLFYKGVVVIVVIVEEFVYIFFLYVASKWGVCVSKEQDCRGIQYPFFVKRGEG